MTFARCPSDMTCWDRAAPTPHPLLHPLLHPRLGPTPPPQPAISLLSSTPTRPLRRCISGFSCPLGQAAALLCLVYHYYRYILHASQQLPACSACPPPLRARGQAYVIVEKVTSHTPSVAIKLCLHFAPRAMHARQARHAARAVPPSYIALRDPARRLTRHGVTWTLRPPDSAPSPFFTSVFLSSQAFPLA